VFLSSAKTVLQTCLAEHQLCRKSNLNFMPTRIIEILRMNGLRTLRLCEARTAEPYTALSYCWGGDQQVATRTNTISQYLMRIYAADLPLTVIDAIKVTEKLGITRIWIDAFCIVQDDPINKAREIAQMPLIYSQATLTIVASRAKGVGEGFLQNRPRMGEGDPKLVFELGFRCLNSRLGSVVLVPLLDTRRERPLDSRAWALQERMLSPRLLDFDSVQTSWICQDTKHRCPSDGYTNSSHWERNVRTALSLLDGPQTTSTAAEIRKHWYQLVWIFTCRKLTFGTDRLPAISGIASISARILSDEYNAGSGTQISLVKCSGRFLSTQEDSSPDLRSIKALHGHGSPSKSQSTSLVLQRHASM
jgi:hypothetical protein